MISRGAVVVETVFSAECCHRAPKASVCVSRVSFHSIVPVSIIREPRQRLSPLRFGTAALRRTAAVVGVDTCNGRLHEQSFASASNETGCEAVDGCEKLRKSFRLAAFVHVNTVGNVRVVGTSHAQRFDWLTASVGIDNTGVEMNNFHERISRRGTELLSAHNIIQIVSLTNIGLENINT